MADFLQQLIQPGDQMISIVGGGGKTTLLFYLAKALRQQGQQVISTTTTRILSPKSEQSEELILKKNYPRGFLPAIERGLRRFEHVTVASELLAGEKLRGLSCLELEAIANHCSSAYFLIEADGARCCSLKAPGPHEPVVPQQSDVFIAVLGLDCIGKRLDTDHVFRPELVAERTGQELGSEITPHTLARLITHPQGLLKGCPQKARSTVLLNKVDITGGQDKAQAVFVAAQEIGGGQPDIWFAASIWDGLCASFSNPKASPWLSGQQ